MERANYRIALGLLASVLVHGLILFALPTGAPPQGLANGLPALRVEIAHVPRPSTNPGSGHGPDHGQAKSAPNRTAVAAATARPGVEPAAPENPVGTPSISVAERPRAKPEFPAAAHADSPVSANEPPAAPAGAAHGVALPGAISPPWASGLPVRPANTAMPNAAYALQMPGPARVPAAAPPADQQAQRRAPALLRQLAELLAARLRERDSNVEGRCVMKETVPGQAALVCSPERIASLLRQDEPAITGMLRALRVSGIAADGFAVDVSKGRVTMALGEPAPFARALP